MRLFGIGKKTTNMGGRRFLVEIGRDLRVESGPRRRKETATEELLSDMVTATHYRPGRYDAAGHVIQVGKPMDYLDYRGEFVWYVYQLQDRGGPLKKWFPIGVRATKAEAVQLAKDVRRGRAQPE